MAFREFIGRHRIVSTVAAPAALGVAAIVAATWALTSTPGPQTADTQLKASVTECHDMVTISVAGRNDTPVAGTTKMLVDANGNELPAALSGDYSSHWVDPVVNAPGNAVGPNSYAAVYIAYPANMSSYEDAVNAGVGNTEKVMHDIAQACPNTKFSIVGYSEGADVVRRVARTIGHQQPNQDGVVDTDHVLGVVILADAGRTAGQGPFPGAKDPFGNPDGFDQKYQTGAQPISGQGALPDTGGDFGSLNGKIASFCSEGDLTCAAPQNISLLQLAANVGRQLDVDSLQRDGLTPATGQDVAVVLGRIAMSAFADIASQPNWMQSNETFLQVLLRVSDPEYKPGQAPKPPVQAPTISQTQLSPLAYLPQKVFNEIVGLIVTNQNTIPVIMSDPYQLTLGPNGTGHHFDYWRDSDPNNGKPLTSAEYAAAWLTALAKQAQAGKQIDPATKPQQADLVAAYRAADDVKAQRAAALSATPTTTAAAPTTTSASPTTAATPTTTASATPTTVAPTTSASTTPAPTTTASPSQTPAPTTVAPTTSPAAPTTTTAAPTTTTVPAAPTTTGAAVRVAN